MGIFISMIKKILREALAFSANINEIDWEKTFSDVKQTCVDPKDVVEYLNQVRANSDLEYSKRKKFDKSNPFIHSKSSFFKKGEADVDIDNFIKEITKKPLNIINTNEKILKSGGVHEYVYKTGIPAFRGIAYDIQNKTFHYINTCPGAGSCAVICYAMKGNYVMYPVAYDSMTRRLNYLLNYPEKYEEQMYNELKEKCKEHNALKGFKAKVLLRWNDSGDFFANRYVKIAENVMKKLKDEDYNVDSYAYTKIANVAKDSDFGDTTFSAGANKKETGRVDFEKQKSSIIVPKELFKGLNLMKIDDEQTLKSRVADFYKFDPETIITYDEMMSAPKTDVPKWNVIVTPNDGDDAGFRKDVKTILLTQH
jgi:hypothetical protein